MYVDQRKQLGLQGVEPHEFHLLPEKDRWWLAGWLEGEGSITWDSKGVPKVCVEATDKDVVEKGGRLMGAGAIQFSKRKQPHHKDTWVVRVRGKKAILLMLDLYPYMGERRRARIQEVILEYGDRYGR